ncbi:MAG TPA: trypsin-like serine protease [Paracoccus sp.]|nr:trypsin-like serine protease [Paracoccus sp. (in: a-proteobacteria)]
MKRPTLAAALLAGLMMATPGPAPAQDNSCRWAHDGECDESRYNGTGACPTGTDTHDCRAEAQAWQRLWSAVPARLRADLGDDSCRWAHDMECDDIRFGGTGACPEGTDASDCRALAIGGDNSCRWADDGECDEPGIGTGVCTSGTDTNDCRGIAFLRNRSNNCEHAFNGTCDEPGSGTGLCRAYSDTADCVGRDRPVTARDHFFGHDDRVMVDVTQMPWRAVGILQLTQGSCTGALIGARLIATAAHCLQGADGNPVKALHFRAGAWGEGEQGRAGVNGYVVAPEYTAEDQPPGGGNGNDWALLTLDRDLGLELGFIPPMLLDKEDHATIRAGEFMVSQAGYSWDTGNWLSGHLGCRVLTAYGDGSIIHDCDTTRGDSGSPILHERDGEWYFLAVDSQFFAPQPPYPAMSSAHLSVDTRGFAQALRDAGALPD